VTWRQRQGLQALAVAEWQCQLAQLLSEQSGPLEEGESPFL